MTRLRPDCESDESAPQPRNVLIRDHADRDTIASQLMRYRDQNGQGWADIIDLLTMYPDARRSVVSPRRGRSDNG
jgi:hypothetical protein